MAYLLRDGLEEGTSYRGISCGDGFLPGFTKWRKDREKRQRDGDYIPLPIISTPPSEDSPVPHEKEKDRGYVPDVTEEFEIN